MFDDFSYISGSLSYMGGNYENATLGAWKPPSNYLPRGEAPPPYEEAMAQCRPETMRLLYILLKVFITGQYFVDSYYMYCFDYYSL